MAWLGSALLQHPAGHGDGALEDNPMAGEPTEKSVRAKAGGAGPAPSPSCSQPIEKSEFCLQSNFGGAQGPTLVVVRG